MPEDENELMARHGITTTQKTVYHYSGCSYGSLKEAVSYAELLAERATRSAPSGSSDRTLARAPKR